MVRRNSDKLRELILYVATRWQDDSRFGVTRLTKALFWADFEAYRSTGEAITGSDYIKMRHGPMLEGQQSLLTSMEWQGTLRIERVQTGAGMQQRPVPLREPDMTLFSADEIDVIDEIIAAHRGKTAAQISDLSHEFLGWRATRLGNRIAYGTALLSTPDLTPEEIAFGMELSYELARSRESAATTHGG